MDYKIQYLQQSLMWTTCLQICGRHSCICKCICKCTFNVKHRECLRDHPSQRLMTKVPDVQIKLKFRNVWFLRRGENRSTHRKTSWSRVENQQQTQPTHDAGSENRTRDTLVGGERSHRCANPTQSQVLEYYPLPHSQEQIHVSH